MVMKKELIKSGIQSEIDHRIKNNLNMISSILGLQILNLKNGSSDSTEGILLKSKLRVEALALVHDALDYSKGDVEVDFGKYVYNLNLLVSRTYRKDIPLYIDVVNISLNTNTMLKLGLVLNELLTNSLEYAFPKKDVKFIKISLVEGLYKDSYILNYSEEGGKIVNINKIRNSKTLGIKLINLVLKEMRAEMNIFQKNGLAFQIKFKSI
jgi:two-component sensor histidine kinase